MAVFNVKCDQVIKKQEMQVTKKKTTKISNLLAN